MGLGMSKSRLLRRLIVCRLVIATGILVSSCTPGIGVVGGGGAIEVTFDVAAPGREEPVDAAASEASERL